MSVFGSRRSVSQKDATITSANIQFTSVAAQPESDTTDLIIKAVNSPNADPFTDATDLRALTPIAELPWAVPLPWNGGNEKGEPGEDAEPEGPRAGHCQP